MVSNGHIKCTKPEHILQFVLLIIIHLIYQKYKNDIQWWKSLGKKYTITFNKETQFIQYYKDDPEVPGEKIIINTTPLKDTHYWKIYECLLENFNYSLNYYRSIPGRAWDRCSSLEEEIFEIKLEKINKDKMNYTYWEAFSYSEDTLCQFFQETSDDAPIKIYKSIIEGFKKCDWYETFTESFPTVEEFLEILEKYKSVVEVDEIFM